MKKIFSNIDAMQKHMHALNINDLKGRMLRIPASKKSKSNREILLLYGHHASLERVYGIAEDFSQYGNVTVPDYPGFGGMDSFYDIGMKPTLDNLADYLATFVKLRYRGKRVTVVGMSLGFVIATRMLQRYPELVKKVDIVVSIVGFTRHDDFAFTKNRMRSYRLLTGFFKHRIPAAFFYNVCLHPSVLRLVYGKTHNAKNKFNHLGNEEKKQAMEFEVILWRENDIRTHMHTARDFLALDNCRKQVNLPVHHVAVEGDQYFDNSVVEQHLQVIFTKLKSHIAVMPNHAPSIVASKEDAAPFIPKGLRRVLKAKT
jgi:pimeloyl-ACP methyl ester carboxylesterase